MTTKKTIKRPTAAKSAPRTPAKSATKTTKTARTTAPAAKRTAKAKRAAPKPAAKMVNKTPSTSKRYAIQYRDGILVRGLGNPFINFSGDFSRAMTFGSEQDAKETAKFINEQSKANGGPVTSYSVIEKTKYKKPEWLTNKRSK